MADVNTNLNNIKTIKRIIVNKAISNHYAVFTASELGIEDVIVNIICVNIPRSPLTTYHFVKGYGWENENLFVYFDDIINGTTSVIFTYYEL